jgi:hypothetical protein
MATTAVIPTVYMYSSLLTEQLKGRCHPVSCHPLAGNLPLRSAGIARSCNSNTPKQARHRRTRAEHREQNCSQSRCGFAYVLVVLAGWPVRLAGTALLTAAWRALSLARLRAMTSAAGILGPDSASAGCVPLACAVRRGPQSVPVEALFAAPTEGVESRGRGY